MQSDFFLYRSSLIEYILRGETTLTFSFSDSCSKKVCPDRIDGTDRIRVSLAALTESGKNETLATPAKDEIEALRSVLHRLFGRRRPHDSEAQLYPKGTTRLHQSGSLRISQDLKNIPFSSCGTEDKHG